MAPEMVLLISHALCATLSFLMVSGAWYCLMAISLSRKKSPRSGILSSATWCFHVTSALILLHGCQDVAETLILLWHGLCGYVPSAAIREAWSLCTVAALSQNTCSGNDCYSIDAIYLSVSDNDDTAYGFPECYEIVLRYFFIRACQCRHVLRVRPDTKTQSQPSFRHRFRIQVTVFINNMQFTTMWILAISQIHPVQNSRR